MDGDNNVLIYGKNTQQGIVSLEVNNDNLEVFIQDDFGIVTSCIYPYKHKIFSNKPLNKNSKKLEGNLHYQYLNTYDTQESWEEVRKLAYHRGYHVFYNKKEEALVCNGASYFKGLKVKDVSVLSFDIESTGLVHDKTSKVLIISNTFRKKDSEPIRKMFTYDEYSTQLDLLNAWCKWVREIDPSIIVGHNIYSYDLKYMQFIAHREGGDLYLGRNNSPLRFEERASKFRKDASQFYEYNRPHIYGRELCDTFFLALKFDIGRKYDSYGLKQIIKQEGLEIKDRQFYDASEIHKNYLIPEEWDKIKDYACFAPNSSLVSLSDSSVKFIEDVQVGDSVITGSGNEEYVYKKLERQYKGKVYSFDIENGRKIHKATSEHPFLVLDEKTLKYVWKNAEDLQENDLLVIGSKKKDEYKSSGYFDKNTLWLFGFFQGDGYIRIQKTLTYPVLTIHISELSVISKKLNEMNLKFSVIKKGKSKGLDVVIFNNKLGQLFLNWSGGKFTSKYKKCSKDFFKIINNSKRNFLYFLAGLLDADGHFKKLKKKTYQMGICLISPHLINVIDLCCSVHHINLTRQNFRSRNNKKLPGGRIRKSKPNLFYELTFFSDSMKLINNYLNIKQMEELNKQYSVFSHKKHVRIRKKYIEDYDGLVYNISVTNDHSFISNGIITHNCHDADDSLALYDLMIPSYFYFTQSIPKAFQSMLESATGAQVNSFLIRSYVQINHSFPKADESAQFEGAISLGNPGSYKNAFKVDVSSLYPSIIIQYEIFDKLKDPKQHFLKSVKFFTEQRLQNKKLAKETNDNYYKDLEQSQKILVNSSYGLLGSTGLNFNSTSNAGKVTNIGRDILTKAIEWSKNKNFKLINGDTDSITFCKEDGSEFSIQEQKDLLLELNSLYPIGIVWEHDGIYKAILVLKAKNYALYDGTKLKIKGSALKATLKEKALQEFINRMIKSLLDLEAISPIDLYEEYVKEILTLKDITRWTTKKTITDKVLDPKRTNEQRVLDAIENIDVQEGDKVRLYFTPDGNVKLEQNWNNDHDINKLLEKLYKTLEVFDTVININNFLNYKLKRNKDKLLKFNNTNDIINITTKGNDEINTEYKDVI